MGFSKFLKRQTSKLSKDSTPAVKPPSLPLNTTNVSNVSALAMESPPSSSNEENSFSRNASASETSSSSSPISTTFHASNSSAIPPQIAPTVTLLHCQQSRMYHTTQVNLINQTTDDLKVLNCAVRGNTVHFYTESLVNPHLSIDILSCSLKVLPSLNAVLLNSKYQVRLPSLASLQTFISAVKLSNFEYQRLSEAYTASLLSWKGSQLSDIHVILAENKFVYQEDCSVKFGNEVAQEFQQYAGKWIQCRVVVKPRKSKTSPGCLELYALSSVKVKTGQKKTTKRGKLICKVKQLSSAFAVFPHVDLIEKTSMIRVEGLCAFYSGSGSADEEAGSRSRSSSIASSINAAAPTSTPKAHKRISSISSVFSTSSFNSTTSTSTSTSISTAKQSQPLQTMQTSLLIHPHPHHAVPSHDTLIRLLIPIYDTFQLYGRPVRLNSDKKHQDSLLFALPTLPKVEILQLNHAEIILGKIWNQLISDELENKDFDYQGFFKSAVLELIGLDSKYCGFGDVRQHLGINQVNEKELNVAVKGMMN
ncbi:hypothetical protein WICPIJ_009458 [Wickerhamomyces pijperi]|uniref:Skg3/CAF120-like PH-like domain-containing protein n=1 Tax=Wickerhamomyces pijperi TaxID=599730 RepID=A0A9P8PNI8_WICPI|nr:hypothetical protein WICPIJ_009458 [Wickerhamomyces pijperi]